MDNIIFSTNIAIPCISLEHWPNLGPICLRGSLHGWTCLRLECWQVPQRSRRIGRTVQHKTDFQGFCAFLLTLLSISWKFLYINSFCPSFECALLFPCTLRTVFWMFSTNGSSWTRSLLDNFSFRNHSLKTSSLLDGLQPTWDTWLGLATLRWGNDPVS